VHDEGIKTPIIQTDAGLVRGMTFSVCDVSKPLVSLSKLHKAGNRVAFDDECYIENKITGDRIPFYEQNGAYQMKVKVFPRQLMQEPEQYLSPAARIADQQGYRVPACVVTPARGGIHPIGGTEGQVFPEGSGAASSSSSGGLGLALGWP